MLLSNLARRLPSSISSPITTNILQRHYAGFKDFFGKSDKDSTALPEVEEDSQTFKNSLIEKDLLATASDSSKLRRIKAYYPDESRVHAQIKQLTKKVFGAEFNETSYKSLKLADPLNKYKVALVS